MEQMILDKAGTQTLMQFWLCFLALMIWSPNSEATPTVQGAEKFGIEFQLDANGHLKARLSDHVDDALFLMTLHPSSMLDRRYKPRVVRFERTASEIRLVAPRIRNQLGFEIVTDGLPLEAGGSFVDVPAVEFAWKTDAVNDKESTAQFIDMTNVFLGDPRVNARVPDRTIDSSNSQIVDFVQYDEVAVIRAEVTFNGNEANGYSRSTLSMVWSLRRLPKNAMPARKHTQEMAFISTLNLSRFHGSDDIVRRFRLESETEISKENTHKTITFYLDPRAPSWSVPAYYSAVDQWNKAFAIAGFENAIRLVPAPTDVNWEAFAAAHSVIWVDNRRRVAEERQAGENFVLRRPLTGSLAGGGGTVSLVTDPRSGEILQSRARIALPFGDGVDYFLPRCGNLDQRAYQIPFEESLQVDLLEVLVAHELGHALGLHDGNYGEFSASSEQLRSNSWLEQHSATAIMNYGRCNAVVQPEDEVDPKFLLPRVSAAEIYQIVLGYSDSNRLQELKGALRSSYSSVALFFGFGSGPQSHNYTTEANDPVRAAELSLRNIRRNLGLINSMPIDTETPEEHRVHLYRKTVEYWSQVQRYVLSMVGGEISFFDDNGTLIKEAIPVSEQKAALGHLVRNAFGPNEWIYGEDVAAIGSAAERMNIFDFYQRYVMDYMIHRSSLLRLYRQQIECLENCLSVEEYLDTIEDSVFSSLHDFDKFRSQQQLQYVRSLISTSNSLSRGTPDLDEHSLDVVLRARLRKLKHEIAKSNRSKDVGALDYDHRQTILELIDFNSS